MNGFYLSYQTLLGRCYLGELFHSQHLRFDKSWKKLRQSFAKSQCKLRGKPLHPTYSTSCGSQLCFQALLRNQNNLHALAPRCSSLGSHFVCSQVLKWATEAPGHVACLKARSVTFPVVCSCGRATFLQLEPCWAWPLLLEWFPELLGAGEVLTGLPGHRLGL